MSSSNSNWSKEEKMQLCESWRFVFHDPITGNLMRVENMWKDIKDDFVKRFPDSTRTDQALQNHWKTLGKELGCWKHAIIEAAKLVPPSGSSIDVLHASQQTFYKVQARTNKNFVNQACWEIVKDCPKFKILEASNFGMNASPTVHSPNEGSPLPMNLSDDEASTRVTRPQGRKAAKAAKSGKNKTSPECSRFYEQMAMQGTINIEAARVREEVRVQENRQRHEAAMKQAQAERDWQTMSMDTTSMSPATSTWWRQQRREVMRRTSGRTLFRDDASDPSVGEASNTSAGQTNFTPVEDTNWYGCE